ncbi:hypothetical protein DYB31_015871, partial [Aphanomyces astaci]
VNALDKVSRVRISTSDLFWFFIRYVVEQPVSSVDQHKHKRLTLLTPLHCAVATSQIDTVRFLVDEMHAAVDTLAVSPSAADRIPPLFYAEHPNIVEILLSAGANLLMVPGSGVQKYLKMKVDPDCLGEHGYIGVNIRTPMHWAAINGQASTVDVLIQGGADPNFQDARGRSPLHWAVRNNKVDAVQVLLVNGADANLQDVKGMTPVICAAFAERVHPDLLR